MFDSFGTAGMVPSGTALDRCSLSVMATPARNRLLQVCRTSADIAGTFDAALVHESEVRVLGLRHELSYTTDDITPPLCADQCNAGGRWLDWNGVCNDGGPGSSSSDCPLGSDCADCGPRSVASLPDHFTCTAGADTCQFASDGGCADGGVGAHSSECPFGSDCSDCGQTAAVVRLRRGLASISGIDEGFFSAELRPERWPAVHSRILCTHSEPVSTTAPQRVHTKAGLAPWRRASADARRRDPDSPPPPPTPWWAQPPSCNNDCLSSRLMVCATTAAGASSPTVR